MEFRAKLLEHQLDGAPTLADEFSGEDMASILLERMEDTRRTMEQLRAEGVTLGPYLELGAERGQRSLVMANDLGVRGAAGDISFHMLRSCATFAQQFDRPRLPLRVVCDANALPYRSGSLPFVFTYQTLHHFPDPGPIADECRRLLAPGGWFYFSEEPVKRRLHLNLYNAPAMYSESARTASKWRLRLDSYFARRHCNETEHGVLENDEIVVGTWRKAFAPFAERRVTLKSVRGMEVDLYSPGQGGRRWLADLFGGSISGLCRVAGEGGGVATIEEALICPACLRGGSEHSVTGGEQAYTCTTCGASYPVVEGVLILLPEEQRRELYPELGA